MEPRPYGPFKYVPINRRPKITWPGGAQLALWVAPNIEYFALDEPLPNDAHQRPGANARTPIVREWGQRDYGNRVGVFRIMEVLERYGIRATVSLNSKVCDAFPEIIEDCLKLDWDFMGHCQGNMHRLNEVPPDEERQYIHDTLARIERAVGRKPAGWLGAARGPRQPREHHQGHFPEPHGTGPVGHGFACDGAANYRKGRADTGASHAV